MLNRTFEYLGEQVFVAKLNEYTFEFIQVIYFGEDDFEYLIIGEKVAYQDWMKADLVGELSEKEASYPFAACYHVFKQLELGNEDWNMSCQSLEEVKSYLKETFDINYDELIAG